MSFEGIQEIFTSPSQSEVNDRLKKKGWVLLSISVVGNLVHYTLGRRDERAEAEQVAAPK